MKIGRDCCLLSVMLLALGIVGAEPIAAQTGDGYLFRPPVATLSVHGGFARPSADSELFSFVSDILTIGRNDFAGMAGGVAVSVPIRPRVTMGVSATYTGRSTASEYRDLVEQDDSPIRQETNFARIPVLATARVYLLEPGRSIGSYAWVPAAYAPYVGAGGGFMWYRFRQHGDFVDYETNEIFISDLEESGWAPALQAVAGVDFSLTPGLVVTGESSYVWSRGNLDAVLFEDFDRIDLSGFSATIGLSLRI